MQRRQQHSVRGKRSLRRRIGEDGGVKDERTFFDRGPIRLADAQIGGHGTCPRAFPPLPSKRPLHPFVRTCQLARTWRDGGNLHSRPPTITQPRPRSTPTTGSLRFHHQNCSETPATPTHPRQRKGDSSEHHSPPTRTPAPTTCGRNSSSPSSSSSSFFSSSSFSESVGR